MTTVDMRVTASADDAHVSNDGGFPGYSHGETFLYIGYVGSRFMYTGMRFPGADIPSGATIDDCVLTMQDANFGTGASGFSANVYAENSGLTPATFSAGSTPSARTRTTANETWSGVVTSGAVTTSPDLTTVAQEVVDDQGGATDLVFILVGTLATGLSGWDVAAFDGDPDAAPRLILNYTAGGGGEEPAPVRRDLALMGVGR